MSAGREVEGARRGDLGVIGAWKDFAGRRTYLALWSMPADVGALGNVGAWRDVVADGRINGAGGAFW